jgi:hypothetical protein
MPSAFDQWLAEVAPVDPREAAAEAAKINRDALAMYLPRGISVTVTA